MITSTVASTLLEDVVLTPDERFALSVDGSATNQGIVSYSTRQNAIVSSLSTSAQAVAISPRSREVVLMAQFFNDSIHRFVIRPDGTLEDSGQSILTGTGPINIIFSPSGEFAFVAAQNDISISVLSTLKASKNPAVFSMRRGDAARV